MKKIALIVALALAAGACRTISLDYQQGLRLSDYLGMAGGPVEQADTNAAVLKRMGQPEVTPINVAKALEKPDSAELNPVLAPGDVVTVPMQFVGGTLTWSDTSQLKL